MNAHAHPSPLDSADLRPAAKSSGEMEYCAVSVDAQASMDLQAARQNGERKIRVYVAAENRMLRESLGRLLVKRGNVEVVGFDMALTCDAVALAGQGAEV